MRCMCPSQISFATKLSPDLDFVEKLPVNYRFGMVISSMIDRMYKEPLPLPPPPMPEALQCQAGSASGRYPCVWSSRGSPSQDMLLSWKRQVESPASAGTQSQCETYSDFLKVTIKRLTQHLCRLSRRKISLSLGLAGPLWNEPVKCKESCVLHLKLSLSTACYSGFTFGVAEGLSVPSALLQWRPC